MIYEFEDRMFPATIFSSPRTKGLHLSDIIRDLLNKTGLGYTGAGFTDMQLTAEVGLLWEDVLSTVAGEKYATIKIGEIEKDGIIMTPDGLGPDPKGKVPFVLEEYKVTWKSTRTHPTEVITYMMQIKSYCWALSTNVCVMEVFYLMGDYKGSGPLYRVGRIEFSDQELRENWNIITKHAKKEGML